MFMFVGHNMKQHPAIDRSVLHELKLHSLTVSFGMTGFVNESTLLVVFFFFYNVKHHDPMNGSV